MQGVNIGKVIVSLGLYDKQYESEVFVSEVLTKVINESGDFNLTDDVNFSNTLIIKPQDSAVNYCKLKFLKLENNRELDAMGLTKLKFNGIIVPE